jgi:Zn ribbon nucleic-acid-binding protein
MYFSWAPRIVSLDNMDRRKAAGRKTVEVELRKTVVDAILKLHLYPGPWWMLNALDCTYFSVDPGGEDNRHAVRRLIDLYVRCAREKKQDDLADLWYAEQVNVIDCMVGSFGVADEKTSDEVKTRLDDAIRKRDPKLEDIAPLDIYWREVTAEKELETQLDAITKDVTKRCGHAEGMWRFWCMESRKEVIEINETHARSRVETFIDGYQEASSVEEENKLISAMLYSDNRIKFNAKSADIDRVFWRYAELLMFYRNPTLGSFRDKTRGWTSPIVQVNK